MTLSELCRRRESFLASGDMCGLCALRGAALARFLSGGGHIAACRERACRWLTEFAGSAQGVKLLDMTGELSVAQIDQWLPAGNQATPADISPSPADAELASIVMVAPAEAQAGLLAAVLSRGLSVLVVQRVEDCPQPASPGENQLVLGNFGDGLPPARDGRMFLDMSLMDQEMVVQAVEMSLPSADNAPPAGAGPAWLPWFPVIDYSRCTQCGQCRNFCLFGVYGQRDAKVAVVNPTHCKPHCPACARICPRCAIIFPKYTQEPINGAEVRPEHLSRQVHPTDLSAMMQGDVQEMLRERQRMENNGGNRQPATGNGQKRNGNSK